MNAASAARFRSSKLVKKFSESLQLSAACFQELVRCRRLVNGVGFKRLTWKLRAKRWYWRASTNFHDLLSKLNANSRYGFPGVWSGTIFPLDINWHLSHSIIFLPLIADRLLNSPRFSGAFSLRPVRTCRQSLLGIIRPTKLMFCTLN
mgnify:CR=1 FL=1